MTIPLNLAIFAFSAFARVVQVPIADEAAPAFEYLPAGLFPADALNLATFPPSHLESSSLFCGVVQAPPPVEDAPPPDGSTARALPALAGIAARLAPTLLKAVPKLSKLTKLTNVRYTAVPRRTVSRSTLYWQ